jgi:hypothetical protein
VRHIDDARCLARNGDLERTGSVHEDRAKKELAQESRVNAPMPPAIVERAFQTVSPRAPRAVSDSPRIPMRSFALSTILAVSCVLSSCSSIEVTNDYDSSVDFNALKSWSWHAVATVPNDPDSVVTLTEARVRSAIESELTGRGYPEVPSGGSFLVAYHAMIRERIEAGADPYGYGWRHGYMGPNVMTYEEGTLLIDFIDPKSKSMIWRGTASAVVDPADSTEKREKRIRDAVKKVLAKFPPKSK